MTAWLWLVTAGLALATLLSRSTLMLLGARVRLPPRLQAALAYAPACALAAIIGPLVLVDPAGEVQRAVLNAPLWATVTAVLVTLWTRSIVAAITAGMAVFWLLRHLAG